MGKTHGFFPWEKPSGKNPPTLIGIYLKYNIILVEICNISKRQKRSM
jgi:hypothetical protein